MNSKAEAFMLLDQSFCHPLNLAGNSMNLRAKSRKLFTVFLSLLTVLHLLPAAAAVPTSATAESVPIFGDADSICKKSAAVDGKELVDTILKKIKAMKGYCFDSILLTYTEKKPITETGRLFFRNPNLLRFEVLKAGMRSGAVVVRQSDGKVIGKMSWGPKMKLAPQNKLLQTANGFSILESDLETLLSGLVERIKTSLACLTVNEKGGKVEVIETLENDGDLVDRIVIDPKEKLPLEWCKFRGSKLFSVLKFVNLKARADLSDGLFNFGSDEGGGKGLEDNEFLASELKSLKNARTLQTLSVAACREVDRTLACIRQDLLDLRSAIGQNGGDSSSQKQAGWDTQARSRMLAATVDAELILSLLDPVPTALHNMGSEGEELSSSFSHDMESSSKNILSLSEEILAEKPDYARLDELSKELSENIESLQGLISRAQSLI